MSPERYDFLVHSADLGHIWREAIRAHRAGEPGIPAREAIRDLAEELAWSGNPEERGILEKFEREELRPATGVDRKMAIAPPAARNTFKKMPG